MPPEPELRSETFPPFESANYSVDPRNDPFPGYVFYEESRCAGAKNKLNKIQPECPNFNRKVEDIFFFFEKSARSLWKNIIQAEVSFFCEIIRGTRQMLPVKTSSALSGCGNSY